MRKADAVVVFEGWLRRKEGKGRVIVRVSECAFTPMGVFVPVHVEGEEKACVGRKVAGVCRAVPVRGQRGRERARRELCVCVFGEGWFG